MSERQEKKLRNYYVPRKKKGEEGPQRPLPILGIDKNLIIPSQHFMSYVEDGGNTFLYQSDGLGKIITRPDELWAKLGKLGYTIDFSCRRGALTLGQFLEVLKDKSKRVERFSNTLELVKDPMTEYTYPLVEAEETGAFKEIIDILTFKDLQSKMRYESMILSAFLPRDFDGDKPFFGILANTKSSGKTTVARAIPSIIMGEPPIELLGDDNDASQYGGVRNMAKKYAVYDNLQHLKDGTMLKITRTITDRFVQSWIMHKSHARVPNNKVYIGTVNSTEFINNDLLERFLTIRMMDSSLVDAEYRIKIYQIINKYRNDRMAVLKDILFKLKGLNIDWKAPHKTCEELGLSVIPHGKFTYWSYSMAVIINHIHPEIKDFNFWLNAEDRELDDATSDFRDMIETVFESHGGTSVRISVENMFHIANEHYGDAIVTKSKKSLHKHMIKMSNNLHDINITSGRSSAGRYWDIIKYSDSNDDENNVVDFKDDGPINDGPTDKNSKPLTKMVDDLFGTGYTE